MRARRRFTVFAVLSTLIAIVSSTHGADETQAPPTKLPKRTGRLWNIANEPFTYQLGITSGSGWSSPITLAPGKYQEIRVPPRGQVSEIAGVHDLVPHIKIQFRQAGAVFRLSLPSRTPSDELVPQWFHVKDSNGFGRFVQVGSPGTELEFAL